jgi:hypothetical protein
VELRSNFHQRRKDRDNGWNLQNIVSRLLRHSCESGNPDRGPENARFYESKGNWIPVFARMAGEVRACVARLDLAAGTDRGTKGSAGTSWVRWSLPAHSCLCLDGFKAFSPNAERRNSPYRETFWRRAVTILLALLGVYWRTVPGRTLEAQ